MALNYESCKIHIGYGGEKSHSATTATTHLYPKSNTERRNTMSTKSTSFFKKLLGSLLSAACLFSGTAVAGTIATTSAALPVAAAATSDAPDFSWDNATVYFLLIDRFKEEMGVADCTIVATGGIAGKVAQYSRHNIILNDVLLLRGLEILYKRNTQEPRKRTKKRG